MTGEIELGRVAVVIPALNEEEALPLVLAELPEGVGRVVVADNGSTDRTAERARAAGAVVVHEAQKGYGAACLKALSALREDPPEVVVFLDGDHSDYPEELPALVAPILRGEVDLVIGSRPLGGVEPGALTPQQRVGNRIACAALQLLYGVRYTDLGPFRAVRWTTLESLHMGDRDWGWTVEMQIKAARAGVPYCEVPARYRRRIGVSKISGTLRGTLGASRKIIWMLARHSVG